MQIYMTVNRLNGKFYIGKNKNCNEHYLGSGLIINRAINKYGRENFYKIILETVDTVEQLNDREKYWIEHYRKTQSDLMYNICNGGEWGDIFTNHPDKELICEKISISQKLKFQNSEYLEAHRKRQKEIMSKLEVRKKLSDVQKRHFESEENREKNRIAQKLSHSRQEVRDKISKSVKSAMSNPEVLKKISDAAKLRFQNEEKLEEHSKCIKLALSNTEVRKKMSDAQKRHFESEENREKNRIAQKLSHSRQEVRKKMSDSAKARAFKSCSIDDIVYNVVWDAVHALGIKHKEICRRCRSADYPKYFYV